METIELGAGSYPEPLEQKMKDKNIKILITIETEDEFPNEWDDEEIKYYIQENINEYVRTSDLNIEEIEV
jgi:hypothetical protein